MVKLIAVLCSLANPANCHEETVVKAGFDALPMTTCMMGDQALAAYIADWLQDRPQYKLDKLKCEIGEHNVRS